jgi:hypothetical protein
MIGSGFVSASGQVTYAGGTGPGIWYEHKSNNPVDESLCRRRA